MPEPRQPDQFPAVSVVVATYGRPVLLPRLVAALEAQVIAAPFEVVLVDDASPDRTPAVLADLAEHTTLDLHVVRRDINGGPAAARNDGIAAARAPLVAFTDDDCVPTPGWLAAGVNAMGAQRRVVVGRTEPDPTAEEGPFSRTLRMHDATFMQTANVLYRRADLEAVGGFDEVLRTGEDTDLGMRVAATGAPVVFAPDALVHHDVSPSDWRAAVRQATRWIDLPAVARRHPAARRLLHRGLFWKPHHPVTLLALAGVVAALVLRRGWPLLALLPWVRHRVVEQPLTADRGEVLRLLPATFAVDATEVATMVRGSVRHRHLLL